MKNFKNLHNIYLEIVKTPFYKNGANGDRYVFASLSRLIALCYQFDSANYTLKQVERLHKSKDADEILCLYQLQNCIISYCGCYDTLLQVIYFAFKFDGKLNDKDDFKYTIEKLRWKPDGNTSHISIKNKLEELLPNNKVTALIKKLDQFMNKSRPQVATLANHLKHGGGLITREYATFIPSVGYVNERFTIIKNKNGELVDIKFPDKTSSFMADWLYPHIVDIKTVIGQMYQQNDSIFKIVTDLYHALGYNKLNLLNNPLNDNYSNPLVKDDTEQTK